MERCDDDTLAQALEVVGDWSHLSEVDLSGMAPPEDWEPDAA